MKFIPRFIGYLQYNIFMLLLFGACIGSLVVLIQPESLLPIDRNISGLSIAVAGVICIFSIQIFYGYEVYSDYLVREHGNKHHIILVHDPYFYQTIIQNIGMARKISGYLYAVTKIWLFTLA